VALAVKVELKGREAGEPTGSGCRHRRRRQAEANDGPQRGRLPLVNDRERGVQVIDLEIARD